MERKSRYFGVILRLWRDEREAEQEEGPCEEKLWPWMGMVRFHNEWFGIGMRFQCKKIFKLIF